MLKLISLLIFFFVKSSFAEYRVYQYSITPKYENFLKVKEYIITSTLAPESYESYHGGKESISVSLLRTWICPGDTSKKEICKSPYNQKL